jgi:hypothetical protein
MHFFHMGHVFSESKKSITSMDGPWVNLAFLTDLEKYVKIASDAYEMQLLNIVLGDSQNLHNV